MNGVKKRILLLLLSYRDSWKQLYTHIHKGLKKKKKKNQKPHFE